MKKISMFLLFLFIIVPSIALAGNAQDASLSDVFLFAPEVRVDEPVSRDVVAVGGTVTISENVPEDVFAVGGSVFIEKDVGGDIRIAGSRVVIDGAVSGNVAVLGKLVEIRDSAQIAGSARIRAEKVIFDGRVLQDAKIDAQEFEQNGSIGGDLQYKKIEQQSPGKGIGWFFRLTGLFGMFVVGLLLVSICPKTLQKAVSSSIERPGRNFLFGLASFAAVPIASLVLMFTVIGVPLGLILVAGYAIALYLAQIFVGIMLGTYVVGAFKGSKFARNFSLMWTMVIGVAALWLIIGIPVLGWPIRVLAVILGLGIFVNIKFDAYKKIEG